MASGTRIRVLTRRLDASDAPVWAIDSAGKLIYLSAAVGPWLGIDVGSLLERRSIAGAPVSDDPLDQIAAALSPPPGFSERGTASLRVQPPTSERRRIEPLEVRFVRVGTTDPLTIAVGGEFNDRIEQRELQDAVAIRQRLDHWRRHHARIATIATAGASAAARRTRARLQVAAATRTHVGLFGPPGSGGDSIAIRIHQASAPGEPLVTVDGPLMDTELLEAAVLPLINRLAEREDARGTALVRGLDEMPIEAQQRLAELLAGYAGRLRLIALAGSRPAVLAEPIETAAEASTAEQLQAQPANAIYDKLVDTLSGLTLKIEPLADRVEDIPLLAAAIVDARHAAGEGRAERVSRAALDALVEYPWPRNFEELDDAMRQAIATAAANAIGVEHLPLAIRSFRVAEGRQPVAAVPSLDEAVRRYEQRLIQAAVTAAEGNRAEAARRLGISRARLIRRLQEEEAS
jgi:DNA-binding NtrC family response regulator